VHVFGDTASAESVDEHELLMHKPNAKPERRTFEPVDALRHELEVFADAIEGYRPFPVTTADMVGTVAAFEAAVKALETNDSVEVLIPRLGI
jgi:predicted dehydrogenase